MTAKEAFIRLFELSEEIVDFYKKKYPKKTVLDEEELEMMGRFFNVLTKLKDEQKIKEYYINLFKLKLYNKDTKYAFLYDHNKVFSYVFKNKITFYLGENISEEKKEELKVYFPIWKVFHMAIHLQQEHSFKIKKNDKVYSELDTEYIYAFKYYEALYNLFMYLEFKTKKKADLKSIKDWCTRKITGDEEDEMSMENIMRESIQRAKQTDVTPFLRGMGIELPEGMDINKTIHDMIDGADGEDTISSMTQMMVAGMNGGLGEIGDPDLEEIEEEVYEEISDDEDEVD